VAAVRTAKMLNVKSAWGALIVRHININTCDITSITIVRILAVLYFIHLSPFSVP